MEQVTITVVVAKNNVDRASEVVTKRGDDEGGTEIATMEQYICLAGRNLFQGLLQIANIVVTVG